MQRFAGTIGMVLALLAAPSLGHAQTTGTIAGTVRDTFVIVGMEGYYTRA